MIADCSLSCADGGLVQQCGRRKDEVATDGSLSTAADGIGLTEGFERRRCFLGATGLYSC